MRLKTALRAISVRLYQDLLHAERFGPTDVAGIEYLTEIKAQQFSFALLAWLAPSRSPAMVLTGMRQTEYWRRKSLALFQHLTHQDSRSRELLLRVPG